LRYQTGCVTCIIRTYKIRWWLLENQN